MKKRDKIRGICAILAVTLMFPWAAAPGFPAYGQKKQKGSQEVEKIMAVASQSEVKDESSFGDAMSYKEDDRLILETAQGGETREILSGTAATPSETTENKGLKEATPSELVQEFFYDEPESVPGYYRKEEDSVCWFFLGRDGEWHYRIYGRREEEELSGWYSCSSKGEIENEEAIIFLEEEYMALAPYVYRASSVETEGWRELEKDFGIQTEDRELQKQMGENEDKSRYDVWQFTISSDFSEEKETGYYFYGYIENGEKEDRTKARWRPCGESGNVIEIQPFSAFMPRAVGARGATVTRQGNTVTIHYEESLGVQKYSNSKSKYAFSIGILFNHTSLTGDSYVGFYPENSTVQDYVVKREIDGICQGIFWGFGSESEVYTYESTNPTTMISGSIKGVKIADKITGTKREWYEDYERESTGFSAVPHIECTLVLTNPSPYITGYGYGVRYVASDGEGGDNNSISLCVGNVDISDVCQEAHEHAGLTRTEPGCTTTGTLTGTCTSCGMSVNQEIPSLGHQSPADYDTTTVPGYKIKNCLRCGTRIETVANLYYVEYYGNGSTGGTTGKTTHYIDQDSPLAANGFVRTGYGFTGWNRDAGGNGAAYQEGQSINNLTLTGGETIRLYAQWQVNSYSIGFDGSGGTDGRTITKAYNSPIGTLPQSSRLGYGFDGWWTERTGGEKITEETKVPAEDITVYARWIPHTYSVRFEGNGAEEGDMGEEKFCYGEEKALPSNGFKRKGYRFTSWEDGEGRRYADGERVQNLTSVDKAVVHLKAGWQPVTYLISWHGGNGVTEGQMPVQMLTYDKEERLFDNQFIKPGYQFKGWSLEENGGGELLENCQKVKNLAAKGDETIHLYAVWSNSPYKITFSPNSGTCRTKEKQVFYDIPIGELPVPEKEDYSFLGWFHEKTGEKLREDTIYRYLENIRLIASWQLQFEDLGNGTNRRPGPDGIYDTGDDKYYTNGPDQEAGTDDDKRIYPGMDGKYGTADDFYIGSQGEKIFAGKDQSFGTEDDYRLYGTDKNERPGKDLIFGTEDDELWWNGADRMPGTEDDKKVYPGEDGIYGTSDDYYQEDKKGKNPVNIHAGQDTIFGTEDDYIDNGNGTNHRPGTDLTFGTEDDELWWNGEDKKPGTEDDREIYPGMDGEYGTRDDYIDNGNGTNTRPGEDLTFGTEDDELWWNGEDKKPGTKDDREIHPGMDGEYGTRDDYIDNGNGTNTRPGEDLTFGTKDDELWWNGEDKKPGTEDDREIHPGADGTYGTEDDYIDNGDGTHTRPGKDLIFGTEDDELWKNGEDGKPGTADDKRADDSAGGGNSQGSGGMGSFGNSSHRGSGSGGSSKASGLLGAGGEGTWVLDHIGWWYRYPDGTWPKDGWFLLSYQGKEEWYHFNGEGYMETGWFTDKDGKKYFLHNLSDGTMGRMYKDWNQIEGKWYYFNPISDGFLGALCIDMKHQEGQVVSQSQ